MWQHRTTRVNYENTELQESFSVLLDKSCKLLLLPSLHNIRVMGVVWGLRANIIRTAVCWVVWHTVHSQQRTYVSSSYRSNRLGLSHWDLYAVYRGGCLELHYFNMVEWFWWDSSLISTTNWFPSVLRHGWFGHLACKNRPPNDLWYVEWGVKLLHYNLQAPVVRVTHFPAEWVSQLKVGRALAVYCCWRRVRFVTSTRSKWRHGIH